MTDKLDKFPRGPIGPAVPPTKRQIKQIDVEYALSEADLDTGNLLPRVKDVLARRWLAALAVFIIVVGGVTLGALYRGPMYRATGLIEIRSAPADSPSVDALLVARRVPDDTMQTEIGMLRSAALAARVVDKLGLAPSTASVEDRQKIVEQLRKELTIDPQQGRLVAVSFDAADPALAARVVNGVMESYIQWRIEDATGTARWLSGQIAESQKQLQASEQRLQAHVRRHGLQIIETGKGESANLVNDRLRQLHSQLAEVQAERYQTQSAFEHASEASVIDQPVIQSLTVRLADLQREYASLSSTFLEDYPKVRQLKEQISQVEKSLEDEVRRGRQQLLSNYQAAIRREALLRNALAEQQSTAQALTGDVAGYEALKREVATNQQLYTALDQKLKDVTISAALRATNMGIVDRAQPTAASSLNFPLSVTVSLAACVGLLLGLGFVFLQEGSDRSVRTVTEVGSQLGLPALATIPTVRRRLGRAPKHVVLASAAAGTEEAAHWRQIGPDTRSQEALDEAFAALRTSVILNNDEPPPRSLLITSASPGEGKTTVAVNLALSLARLNERVLLIDFDLRAPTVGEALHLEPRAGVSDCLMKDADWRTCRQPGPVSCLEVLTAGKSTADSPSELALSPRLRQLLAEAVDEYDFVIVDSAPVLSYPADVRSLAALVDGTLLIVRSGFTSREVVREAWMQLRRPLGIVLNGASPRAGRPYGYADASRTQAET